MGMFNKSQKEAAANVYANLSQYLKPKDGKTHVVMINSFSKWLNLHAIILSCAVYRMDIYCDIFPIYRFNSF